MTTTFILLLLIQAFILIMGISVGRSIILLKLRSEENRKRELELSVLEKRTEILQQGQKIAHDLEEVLYKAKVAQEIEDIMRKNHDQ